MCSYCNDSKWERILGRDNDEIVIPCSMCQMCVRCFAPKGHPTDPDLCGACNAEIDRMLEYTERICPFCGKTSLGSLPADCSRCEATDGPGTGTPLIKYEGIPWLYYQPAQKPEGIR